MQPTSAPSINPSNLKVGDVRYHDKQCYIVLPNNKEVSVVHITGAANEKIFTAGQTLNEAQEKVVLEILRVSFAGQHAILAEVAKRKNSTTVTFEPTANDATVSSAGEANAKYEKTISQFKLTKEKMQEIQKVFNDAITFLFAADKKETVASSAGAAAPKAADASRHPTSNSEAIKIARSEIDNLLKANKLCNAHKIRKVLTKNPNPQLEKRVKKAYARQFELTEDEATCKKKLINEASEKERLEVEQAWLKTNKEIIDSMLKKEMAEIFIENLPRSNMSVQRITTMLEKINSINPEHYKIAESEFIDLMEAFEALSLAKD